MTLHLLHHRQCFGKITENISFGSHIWTLLCSLFVVVLTLVVLTVIYFDHLKKSLCDLMCLLTWKTDVPSEVLPEVHVFWTPLKLTVVFHISPFFKSSI